MCMWSQYQRKKLLALAVLLVVAFSAEGASLRSGEKANHKKSTTSPQWGGGPCGGSVGQKAPESWHLLPDYVVEAERHRASKMHKKEHLGTRSSMECQFAELLVNDCDGEKVDVLKLLAIAVKAGEEIMRFFDDKSTHNTKMKSDNTPVTAADLAANEIIRKALTALYPKIPILSEENELPSVGTRARWREHFSVDPLDGTKEFAKGRKEFTVNIGYVKGAHPVAGVVYVPATGAKYWGAYGHGAYKKECDDSNVQKIEAREFNPDSDSLVVVASSSHSGSRWSEEYIKKAFNEPKLMQFGSSLKLLRVAEGAADAYPRFVGSSEWDTCASQAIVEAAGGIVLSADTFEPLTYNKDTIGNPFFVVYGKLPDSIKQVVKIKHVELYKKIAAEE